MEQIENGSKGKSVQVMEVIEVVVVCWSQRMLLVVRLARLECRGREQVDRDEQDESEQNGLDVSRRQKSTV